MVFVKTSRQRALRALLLASVMSFASAAASAEPLQFDIPAEDLRTALLAFSKQSKMQVTVSPEVRDRQAPALRGAHEPLDALKRLLGDELTFELLGPGNIIVRPGRGASVVPAVPVRTIASEMPPEELLVTGSRIRGAVPTAPVVTLTQQQLLDAGITTLTDAIRNIPQNFGGGQNPGVGSSVPEARGTSLGGGASINLRGLGSDATLTLLNGHRLAYNFGIQSVDISSIPFGAIDRIEIVATGSSALYGSDAVAGVANIVLRRNYDGASASVRIGGSADGGNLQQQYSGVVGTGWGTGRVMVAAEVEHDGPIKASDRDYAATRAPSLYLAPQLRHQNAILTVQQSLSENLSFELDALYNKRHSYTQYALDAHGDVNAYGALNSGTDRSFVIAPTLKLSLGRWQTALAASYGSDETDLYVGFIQDRKILQDQSGCYCNKARTAEINGDGPLFSLPGGPAKLAVGAGYRDNQFHRVLTLVPDLSATQETYYGFAEADLPLVAPGNGVAGVDRFTLSAAVRHEDFPGVGRVTAPKVGFLYSPVADVDIKGSWGRSFRAPTLLSQYTIQYALLYTAARLGATGYPPSATAILLSGGNPDLKPEHATSWTGSIEWRPAFVKGLRLETGYFNTAYRDRIVTPIPSVSQSLRNPIYRDLVTYSPTPAQLQAAIAGAQVFASNAPADVKYDPANVIALVNANNRNAANQTIEGIDLAAEYRTDLGRGALMLNADATWLRSTQKLSALQPSLPLSGTIFSPPHLRARAGAVWNDGTVTLAGYYNYTGGVDDNRTAPSYRLGALTTIDLNAGYRFSFLPIARDLDVALSVQNLFNEKPSLIRNTQVSEVPYDSTNYNSIGRFVSLRISASW